MKQLIKTYYQIYIRWLAFRWMFQTNLGDLVNHKGRTRAVINGVVPTMWTLDNPYEEHIQRGECSKVFSISNLYGSYKSGVNFYTGYWLDIWVNQGIKDWMRECAIWPVPILKRLKLILAVTVASCLWAGCTSREIYYGGAYYKSVRLGNKETIGGVSITTPEGVTFKMDTYSSDQVQAIGAVAEGVAKGLAASAKP